MRIIIILVNLLVVQYNLPNTNLLETILYTEMPYRGVQ